MTDANDIRRIMNLMEGAADYVGPKASDTISYDATEEKGQITKIVATLKSRDSEKYTKLGRNLLRIEALEKEVKELKEEAKAESKELIADLFNAEDVVSTRVVDTVGFLFEMSKNPKATESYKYAEVLKEFEKSLTPELLIMLGEIKEKFKTTTQKSPSLKAKDKAVPVAAEESIVEGVGDKLKGFFAKFLNHIKSWAKNYDAKLGALKAELSINDGLEEAEASNDNHGHSSTDDWVEFLWHAGKDSGDERMCSFYDGLGQAVEDDDLYSYSGALSEGPEIGWLNFAGNDDGQGWSVDNNDAEDAQFVAEPIYNFVESDSDDPQLALQAIQKTKEHAIRSSSHKDIFYGKFMGILSQKLDKLRIAVQKGNTKVINKLDRKFMSLAMEAHNEMRDAAGELVNKYEAAIKAGQQPQVIGF